MYNLPLTIRVTVNFQNKIKYENKTAYILKQKKSFKLPLNW